MRLPPQPIDASADNEDLDLIYKIEGDPNEIDVFELARVLDAFGTVLKEGYRIVHPATGELTVKVKAFANASAASRVRCEELLLTVMNIPVPWSLGMSSKGKRAALGE